MEASPRPGTANNMDINHLRRGTTYSATTRAGRVTTGRYLGIEVPRDDWHIMLRTASGTSSIAISDLESVLADAA